MTNVKSRVEAFRRMIGLVPIESILELSYNKKYNLSTLAKVRDYSMLAASIGVRSSLPFKDNSSDLVLLHNTLSHITPDSLQQLVNEIIRVANTFVLVIDQYSFSEEQVGNIWKRDYATVFYHLRAIDWGDLTKEDGFEDEPYWWLFEKIKLPFTLEFV